MNRRDLLQLAPVSAAGPSALSATPVGMDDLRITGVRPVSVQPNRPVPKYEPPSGS